jgi:PAS domain S-box-containing protein
MKDTKKKKDQLIYELNELRQRIAGIEKSDREFKETKDALSIVYDAIDSAVSGIIITSNNGHITYVNPSFLQMFDYDDKTEVLGKNAADLFPGEEIKKFADLEAIIDLTEGLTEEFSVQGKDGNMFTVETSSSNVKDSEGGVVGRMASFVNITARKRLEQEKEKLVSKLQDALDRIDTLRGFIPICSSCKNIRDDKGFWHRVEEYIRDHSLAQLSHSLCPSCAKQLYPDIYESKGKI